MLTGIHHCRKAGSISPFWSWPIPEALWNLYDALREAVVAHRRYERLRSRGVPHDTALREALGMGHSIRECRLSEHGQRRLPDNAAWLEASASIGALSFMRQ
jgi:hypothetical protein